MVLELVSQDDRPLELRRGLAACFHELLKYKSNLASLKKLNRLLANFVQDTMLKESGVQTQLCQNLATIIDNYFSGIEVRALTEKIIKNKKLLREDLTIKKNSNEKGGMLEAKESGDNATKILLTRTSSHKSAIFMGINEDNIGEDFSADRLFEFVQRDCFPEDKLEEVAYSHLLEHFVLLFDKIIIS